MVQVRLEHVLVGPNHAPGYNAPDPAVPCAFPSAKLPRCCGPPLKQWQCGALKTSSWFCLGF